MNPPSSLQLFLCGVVLLALWHLLLIVRHQLQEIAQSLSELHPELMAVLRKRRNFIFFSHFLTFKRTSSADEPQLTV